MPNIQYGLAKRNVSDLRRGKAVSTPLKELLHKRKTGLEQGVKLDNMLRETFAYRNIAQNIVSFSYTVTKLKQVAIFQ